MRVTTGPRLRGPGSVLECTQLGLAGAVGDGLERSLGLQEMVAFDSLGAPFWRRLGEHVRQPAAPATQARLRTLLADGPVAGWPGARDSPSSWRCAPGGIPAEPRGPAVARFKHRLRDAGQNTVAGIWQDVDARLATFELHACGNRTRDAGHDPTEDGNAPAIQYRTAKRGHCSTFQLDERSPS